MNITLKKLPQSKIELTIEVLAEEWAEFIREASRELAQDLKVAGFRQGRTPLEIVRQKVGEKKLFEKATELAIKKSYVRAILEKNIKAIGAPNVQILKLIPGQELSFKAEVAVLPEIKLADYKKICHSVKRNPQKVEPKEIEEGLSWLQKSRSKFVTVSREAKKGDRIEIDYEMSSINSDASHPVLLKAPAELRSTKNFPVILGETKLIPGFEENLLGMKEGEEKTFSLVLPKNFTLHLFQGKGEGFNPSELAEKLADFKVKMKLVQERELPRLDDGFASSLGNLQNLEALKKSISEGLLMEKEKQEKERWRIKVIEKIAQESKMELPEMLIEGELDRMMAELKGIAQQVGLSFEQYLNQIKKSERELRKTWRERAATRVKVALALKEIAQKEKIEVSDSEIEEQVNKSPQHYQTPREASKKVDIERLKEYSRGVLRNEKVFQLLEAHNK